MLQRLSIRNYAIIDELDIDFSGQLNVITGETGAGKSIIAGALGLILGDRADAAALVNKEKKCIIEGTFSSGKEAVKQFLKSSELDQEEELVLRREIGVNGKSRAFINDTPVNLSQLQELSTLLVDLHRQFDTQAISEADFQREVLDALAGQGTLLEKYQACYRKWVDVKKQWADLLEQKHQFDKEADYHQFQFNELNEVALRPQELEDIEAELKMMQHAEDIKAALAKAYASLEESDTPLVQELKVLLNQLTPFTSYHPGLPVILERLRTAQVELQDISAELDRMGNQVNYDPQKIELLNERLSAGYKLQKKHGVQSTAELLAIQQQLETKLQAVVEMDEVIAAKEKETATLLKEAMELAGNLSRGRLKQVKSFEANVNKLLAQVGMPNAKLKVEIRSTPPGLTGTDSIEFLFDANLPAGRGEKTGQFQPVRKVASGGELSRLMLCIKSLVAQSIDLPTLIFDEIDTGISGEAARQVGIIMKELAIQRQVICITHQPQIAGKADRHFFVYKEIINDRVRTNIRQLSMEERITTIAQMLSGEKPTAAAIENAREMVRN